MPTPELRLVKWGRCPSYGRVDFLWAAPVANGQRTKRCRACLKNEKG